MRKLNKELGPERKQRKLDTIYMFGCVDISVLIDTNGNIWFKGVDLARALELEDPYASISKYIDDKYTMSYENLGLLINDQYRHIPGP